jgi:hypothetical protein
MISEVADSRMSTVRRGVSVAAVIVLVMIISSCGGKEPLQFGTLELSGKKIDETAPSSGVAPSDDWPDACSLLEKGEVKSLLPGAKVTLKSKDVKVLGGPRNGQIIPDGQCQVETDQPGGRRNYSDLVWVDVMAWGAPDAVQARVRTSDSPSNKDLGNTIGPEQCVEVGGADDSFTPTLRCSQGPLAFEVRGSVGSKTQIAGATSESDEVMLWYDNVVKPVARAVGAHVPA